MKRAHKISTVSYLKFCIVKLNIYVVKNSWELFNETFFPGCMYTCMYVWIRMCELYTVCTRFALWCVCCGANQLYPYVSGLVIRLYSCQSCNEKPHVGPINFAIWATLIAKYIISWQALIAPSQRKFYTQTWLSNDDNNIGAHRV